MLMLWKLGDCPNSLLVASVSPGQRRQFRRFRLDGKDASGTSRWREVRRPQPRPIAAIAGHSNIVRLSVYSPEEMLTDGGKCRQCTSKRANFVSTLAD